MSNRVLVVAAHPDDEVLGVGGTIVRHAAAGDEIHILIMAEGLTSRDDERDAAGRAAELAGLRAKSERAAKLMGASKVTLLGFPDNRMDAVPLLDIIKPIEREVEDFCPNIVYTHHAGDVNIDHELTHRAVITACRPLQGCPVKEIYFFETLSSTEWREQMPDLAFLPNLYVDIGKYLDKKMDVLQCYDSEMRRYPHSRSYEAVRILAEYRGFLSGRECAEAFMVGRILR